MTVPDDDGDPPRGMNLAGPRLRELRTGRGLSLREVAEIAGVTKGFLSLVERGKSQVSVPTLLRICDAIEVRLGSLFEYPSETVVRGGAVLEMGGVGLQEFLLTPSSETRFQVQRTVLQPGGGSGGAYRTEAETIFALVTRGALGLIVDGEPRDLQAGDSTTFSAGAMHEWQNASDGVSEVMWVVAPGLPQSDPRLR